MISLRSSLEKLSAGARVIFGVAALLENTPFELYTLIRSGSLIQLQAATRNAIGDHEPTHDLEICRDHRVCRTRRWREMDSRFLFRDALTRRQRRPGRAACFGGE